MRDGPAVSVIVPVYNVERYVGECIESIRGQSFRDLEILLLDDGSTDGSGEICRRHAALDDRIRTYRHDNRGLGPTRNRGIRLAKGRYLAFVDSDDWIDPDHLRDLYGRAVETGADITEGEIVEVWDGEVPETPCHPLLGTEDRTLSAANVRAFFRDCFFRNIYTASACGKLYDRSFVDRWGLEFGDNRTIFAEDQWFQLQALVRYPHISFVSGGRYRYRQRTGSIIHSPKKDLFVRQRRMLSDLDRLLLSVPDLPIQRELRAWMAASALTVVALDQTHHGGDRRSFFRELEGMRDDPVLISRIADLSDPKVRSIEPQRGRRAFLGVVGALYRLGALDLAHLVVWWTYRIKERRQRTL